MMENHSISQYFEKDHDRLDGLFRTFQKLKRSNFILARESFVEFKFGLQRHIVWEEYVLFPLFEEKTGDGDFGPTAVMRKEHRLIGATLEAIHQKVQRQDPSSDLEEESLLSVLTSHNLKEERILYPAIDDSLDEGERAEAFRRMEEIPPERYEKCC